MHADLDAQTIAVLRALGCTCDPPRLVLGEGTVIGCSLVTPLAIAHDEECPYFEACRRRAVAPLN